MLAVELSSETAEETPVRLRDAVVTSYDESATPLPGHNERGSKLDDSTGLRSALSPVTAAEGFKEQGEQIARDICDPKSRGKHDENLPQHLKNMAEVDEMSESECASTPGPWKSGLNESERYGRGSCKPSFCSPAINMTVRISHQEISISASARHHRMFRADHLHVNGTILGLPLHLVWACSVASQAMCTCQSSASEQKHPPVL